jgi:hypothetical protein
MLAQLARDALQGHLRTSTFCSSVSSGFLLPSNIRYRSVLSHNQPGHFIFCQCLLGPLE